MDKVTGQCPQTTTFSMRKESRSGIEPRSFRLPAYRLIARPNRLTDDDDNDDDDRLYSAILRSRANSLRSHVILYESLAFYSTFLNIHRSGVRTTLAWLEPHETAAASVRSVYTIQPCTLSFNAKPHT